MALIYDFHAGAQRIKAARAPEVLYEGPEGRIVSPRTAEQAAALTKDSGWAISKPGKDIFDTVALKQVILFYPVKPKLSLAARIAFAAINKPVSKTPEIFMGHPRLQLLACNTGYYDTDQKKYPRELIALIVAADRSNAEVGQRIGHTAMLPYAQIPMHERSISLTMGVLRRAVNLGYADRIWADIPKVLRASEEFCTACAELWGDDFRLYKERMLQATHPALALKL